MNIYGNSEGSVTVDLSMYAQPVYIDSALEPKLTKYGDVMTGNLNMNNNKTTVVTDPTSVQEAATEKLG